MSRYLLFLAPLACPQQTMLIDSHLIIWPAVAVNITVTLSCPPGKIGDMLRKCDGHNTWGNPNLKHCKNVQFQELEDLVRDF